MKDYEDLPDWYYDRGDGDYLYEGHYVIGEFETKEEAEKAVEKLKALKRLKDKGFRTYDVCKSPTGTVIHFDVDWQQRGVADDIDLLFGGEK